MGPIELGIKHEEQRLVVVVVEPESLPMLQMDIHSRKAETNLIVFIVDGLGYASLPFL